MNPRARPSSTYFLCDPLQGCCVCSRTILRVASSSAAQVFCVDVRVLFRLPLLDALPASLAHSVDSMDTRSIVYDSEYSVASVIMIRETLEAIGWKLVSFIP